MKRISGIVIIILSFVVLILGMIYSQELKVILAAIGLTAVVNGLLVFGMWLYNPKPSQDEIY